MTLGVELTAVGALTWRDLLRFSRDRAQIAGALGRPAIWMLLFAGGLRHAVPPDTTRGLDYGAFAYAGAIAMTMLFGGMFQGVTIVWDREFGMLREVLVAPISRASIVLGKTTAGACITVLQGLVAAAFAPVVGVRLGLAEIAATIPAMTLLAFGITAFGVALGSRMRSFEGFGVLSNFVVLPLYFLSGGVFPVASLPGWMRMLVALNPVTYGVDLLRAALGQPHDAAVVTDLLVLGAFTTGMIGLALALFRRTAH
jgi:ABC-2 type transport system permease protein